MRNILRQFFHCEIDLEDDRIPRDKDYRRTLEKISKERAHFKETLPPEEEKRLEDLDDLRFDAAMMEYYAHFTCGLRLGIQLMSEVYGREDLTAE